MSYQYHRTELDDILKALGSAAATSSGAGNAPSSTASAYGSQEPHRIPLQDGSRSQAAYYPRVEQPNIQPIKDDSSQDDYDPASFMPWSGQLQPKSTTNPIADPTTIIHWKPALRHVTRLVSTDPAVQERIRKMARTQRDHETQWWKGREALVKQQAARVEGRKKLGDLLRNVGGAVDPAVGGPSPEEEREELDRYDRKVHSAYGSMQKDYQNQFAAMGIPFFNTKAALITDDENVDQLTASNGSEKKADVLAETVARSELIKLQKRMIDLLEDLCSD